MREPKNKYPRIKDLREDKDMSQQEVADILSVTQSSYARYEIGDRSIPIELAIKLCDFYGCSLDYLFGRTNT